MGALGGDGPVLTRLSNFAAQPAMKKALPWFVGVAAIGAAALAWQTLAPSPQRVLYTQLDDSERASVVAALDKGNVTYHIDNNTGVLTVNEDELYKARMLVAQNGALALPEAGGDALDKMPMGASHAVEDERLNASHEHDLELSIKEIDGVQGVRVHIAQGEKSVFVRDTVAPSASVMVHLADGRQLSDGQVQAIVNLVAGSVPGMTPDGVHVVDQHGRLLTAQHDPDSDRLELQTRLEDKLEGQVSQLLTPMLGDGNFSSQVQVDLDMDQLTSARESYDKQGALRTETQSASAGGGQTAVGVPGVLSNSPPPQPVPSPGAPGAPPTPAASGAPGAAPGAAGANPTGATAAPTPAPGGENSASRTWELGRDVSVTNQTPGRIKRLSVAVALSKDAMAKFKQSDIDQIKGLVSAAVGADPTRGDVVTVAVRTFDSVPVTKVPFWQQSWFGTVLHNAVALIGLILVLLMVVRPLVKAVTGDKKAAKKKKKGKGAAADEDEDEAAETKPALPPAARPATQELLQIEQMQDPKTGIIDANALGRQVGIAKRLVDEKPDNALIALRQMLNTQPEVAE